MLHRAELARSQQIGSIVEATTWHWSQTLVALGARCATATTLDMALQNLLKSYSDNGFHVFGLAGSATGSAMCILDSYDSTSYRILSPRC